MAIRIKWFMRHPIQSKYLLVVLTAMLAPTILIGYCFYTVIFNLMAKQIVFPEAVYAQLGPVIDTTNYLLIIFLPVVILLIFIMALVISHRFAGPIERLETSLDDLISGHEHSPIRLRKNDDLKGVADRINVLVKRLKP